MFPMNDFTHFFEESLWVFLEKNRKFRYYKYIWKYLTEFQLFQINDEDNFKPQLKATLRGETGL